MSVITLTTDFGTRDWFVGAMKGVILGIERRATVVDLTHEVAPGDIRGGAFALASACRFFSSDTVHVAVVDPGVGSRRKGLAVRTDCGIFVGPDNGVLSWALARARIKAVHALENPAYFVQPVSQTFHGRDIFAPVAAYLSRGVPIANFGPGVRNFVRLAWPEPVERRTSVKGEVIHIDRFGNAITNLDGRWLEGRGRVVCEVHAPGRRICPLKTFYQAVGLGKPLALVGSAGLLEIAVNGGSAAKGLGLKVGTRVVLRPG